MPNWCNNTLIISHPDPAMIEKAVAAWNGGNFLSTLVPEPDYPGYQDCEVKERGGGNHMPDWWNWRIANWGTKWDIGYRSENDNRAEIKDGKMAVGFDSAWSPPTKAYDSLVDQGFSILAYYYEPGCNFCGRYQDGIDDCYEASDLDSIPEDIQKETGFVD